MPGKWRRRKWHSHTQLLMTTIHLDYKATARMLRCSRLQKSTTNVFGLHMTFICVFSTLEYTVYLRFAKLALFRTFCEACYCTRFILLYFSAREHTHPNARFSLTKSITCTSSVWEARWDSANVGADTISKIVRSAIAAGEKAAIAVSKLWTYFKQDWTELILPVTMWRSLTWITHCCWRLSSFLIQCPHLLSGG